MKRNLVWDAVPEIDQHDIRYSGNIFVYYYLL